ncbi:MAG TPA: hypothetical protein VGQ79_07890 [Nitrospiraceae bacterium]|jgi:hypothetical protein|nr:hypothetical protein [Nitrospiraceae bacterium]
MAFRIVTTVCGLYAILVLSGCSIAMALSGHPEPNFDYVKVGATREEVEFEMGAPVAVQALSDGKQEATYKYEMGNTVNPGRASMWGYAWLTIIGILGEPIYSIIELTQGHDEETKITYGPDNRALALSGYTPPPMSAEMRAAQEEQEKHIRKCPAPRSDQPTTPLSPASTTSP